ncbi:RagB/SusD family nutrient uptake outer membrane protein [Thermophagus sp. OGC60D27]|uniref:RagB/SusD family nutrient uptake outer membrane protein n=1 Tax=Thermophagus sp. OGC60D27 TaxID=3458415 RepID=UPI004037762D
MRKIYVLIVIFLGIGILFSCSDYLESDQYFKDRMTEEKVFESKQYSEEWLAHTFSFLTNECADVCSKGYTPHCFADDMYYGDRDGNYDSQNESDLSYNEFHMGDYSENDKQATWEQCYKGIRNATTFIMNIDLNQEMTKEEIADYKAQARFVRAYYYWLLLRKYGPIPLLPDDGIDYTNSYDDIAIPRSTYEECAEYISNEMVLAAKDLQVTRRDEQSVARPTRGAALATRAKVLLYAASPLANGNTDQFAQDLVDDEGNPLLSSNYDEEKWARAAAAARDVMELGIYELYVASFRNSGNSSYPATIVPPYNAEFSEKTWPDGWANIDPFESYRAVFNGTLNASENPELIFTRGNNGGESLATMVAHQLPRIASGWNTHGLTQKQCDAYYMNDGTDCPGKDKEIGRGDGSDRLTGFVTQEDLDEGRYKPLAVGASLQYADREPRFYASVAFNGSVWHMENESQDQNREQQVFYYRGDGNGYTNTMFWLRTGIGVMKFVHPRDTYENGDINKIVPKTEPAIRYADILLMYAEALNELDGTYNIPSWDGSQTYTISRDINEMKRGIRPVRIRAGVPDFSTDEYADRDKLRAKLKRERQIELLGEGQRYYDLRRWKDAPEEEALPVYGCNTLMTAEQKDLFHTPVVAWALQSTFSRKMWFWPIAHDELKRNKRLTQNPGWTYND